MGADGIPVNPGETPKQVKRREIQRFAAMYRKEGGSVLATAERGSRTWRVVDSPRNAERGLTNPFIALTYWRLWPDEVIKKDVTEQMGPSETDIPRYMLDMAPVANKQWRERVSEWHRIQSAKHRHNAQVKKEIKPGRYIEFKDGYSIEGRCVIKIHSVRGRYILLVTDQGRLYKTQLSKIERILPAEDER